jgi:hypothetical protein
MEQNPKAGGQPVAIRDLRFDVERHRVDRAGPAGSASDIAVRRSALRRT